MDSPVGARRKVRASASLWGWFSLILFAAPVLAQVAATPPLVQQQTAGSRVWIGRYAEYEDYLRTARIERQEGIDIGVTGPRRAFFTSPGLAASAIVKNLPPGKRSNYFESYKSEIAAYKLDRMLQLDMVPPTVERQVGPDLVAVQLWVENARMLKEVQAKKLHAPDPQAWNRQLHRFQVFDNLVGNIDSNAGNLLFDPEWSFVKVDHSRAFTTTQTLLFAMTRIDWPFYDRVKALTEQDLRREIGDLLETSALPALLSRRDAIVKTFEDLARTNGEAAVFEP